MKRKTPPKPAPPRPKAPRAPQVAPNPLQQPDSRWQRFQRYVWDKRK